MRNGVKGTVLTLVNQACWSAELYKICAIALRGIRDCTVRI